MYNNVADQAIAFAVTRVVCIRALKKMVGAVGRNRQPNVFLDQSSMRVIRR